MASAAPDTRQNIARILRRWDGIANQQLAAAAARLADENDQLRSELQQADAAANSWRDDALRMMEDACATNGSRPGITMDGALVVIPAAAAQVAA